MRTPVASMKKMNLISHQQVYCSTAENTKNKKNESEGIEAVIRKTWHSSRKELKIRNGYYRKGMKGSLDCHQAPYKIHKCIKNWDLDLLGPNKRRETYMRRDMRFVNTQWGPSIYLFDFYILFWIFFMDVFTWKLLDSLHNPFRKHIITDFTLPQ